MQKIKDKFQSFVFGIIIGLLVAGSFFIFKLDTYFKELNFYKTLTHTFSTEKNKNKFEDDTNSEKIEIVSSKEIIKSKSIKNLLVDSLPENNLLSQKSIEDTLNEVKNLDTSISNYDEDVIVKKDQLLFSKIIEIVNLNPVALKTTKDSALQKASGIREDRMQNKDFLTIEFWQSPLNYKGYKNSRYKLIAYGISYNEGIKVFKLEYLLYLKTQFGVFQIEYTLDFKPYERIVDEAILSKLK